MRTVCKESLEYCFALPSVAVHFVPIIQTPSIGLRVCDRLIQFAHSPLESPILLVIYC